jgi:hypothetical protein
MRIYDPNSVGNWKTYSLAQPIATHTRRATCEEVDCEHYREGWTYDVRQLDDQLIRAIRLSGKRYREQEHLGVTYWVFPPGQQCFKTHRVSNDREPFHFLTPHSRQLNRRTATLMTPDNWLEDFALHQEKIKEERGQ